MGTNFRAARMRAFGEDESGQALVVAVFVLALVATSTTFIFLNSRSSSQSLRAAKQDAVSLIALKDAAQSFELVLRSNIATEGTNWNLPNAASYAQAGLNAHTLPPTSPFAQALPQNAPGTPITPSPIVVSNGDFNWQIVRIYPPIYPPDGSTTFMTNNAANLVVVLRGWMGSGGDVSRARLFRAEYRPTWFSDYEIIADQSIALASGFVLNGHIHSNGFLDGYTKPAGCTIATDPACDNRVWFRGTAALNCGAQGIVSTARGSVSANINCRRAENTGKSISLAQASNAIELIRRECVNSPGTARCIP